MCRVSARRSAIEHDRFETMASSQGFDMPRPRRSVPHVRAPVRYEPCFLAGLNIIGHRDQCSRARATGVSKEIRLVDFQDRVRPLCHHSGADPCRRRELLNG